MSNQSISIAIEGIDRFSAPAQKIAKMSDKMSSALSKGVGELKALSKQSKDLGKLQKLEKTLGKTGQEMDKARKDVKALGIEMANTRKPTKALVRDFDNAKRKTNQLKQKHREQKTELDQLKGSLKSAGIEGRNFAQIQGKISQKMEASTQKMRQMAKYSAQMSAAQAKYDKTLQRSANMTLVAQGAIRAGEAMTRTLLSPIAQMRGVEKAKGELSSVGVKDLGGVVDRGNQLSSQYAGINTANFVRAAYDIKSGISSLSDKGVADMTANAAITAKATKSNVSQMTSLFATAYGSFKGSLFSSSSDSEFGNIFSAQLAKSVQSFKTDGSKMQQAIQTMGSGLAASGVSLSDQLTGLGMLQQKMQSGEAGTTLKAIERSASTAQERFEKMGYAIKTLDENGNLRRLPDLLGDVQDAFGKDYSTATGAKLLEAFGSDEAVKFFKALWGQQAQFKKNSEALHQAGIQGASFTESMAKLTDANMDAKLAKMGQRWDVIQQKIGYSLVPVLERLLSVIEPIFNAMSSFIEKHQLLTTVLIGAVGVVGGVALVMGSVGIAAASLTAILGALGLSMKKRSIEAAARGLGSGSGAAIGGTTGKTGRLGAAGKFMKGKGLGAVAVIGGGLMLAETLSNDKATTGQKVQETAATIGGVGGMLTGASAGALIGSIVPFIGTAVGGIIGGAVGAWAGSGVANDVGGAIGGYIDGAPEQSSVEKQVQTQSTESSQKAQQPSQSKVIHNTPQFNITQQPGESAEELAQRIIQIQQDQAMRTEFDVG
jgi:hypothetical protein